MVANNFLRKEELLSKIDPFGIGTIICGIVAILISTAYYFNAEHKERFGFKLTVQDAPSFLEPFILYGHTNIAAVILVGLIFIIVSLLLFFYINQSKARAEYIAKTKTRSLEEVLLFQKLIMDSIPDLIFIKDEKFRIIAANNAFLNAYPEDQRESIIGSTTIEQYNDEQAKEFLENDRYAFDTGLSEVEEEINLPNGLCRTFLTKKVRFENQNAERFILGIARDITDRKLAEDEILRSNDELERFAYIASHDLQEPLRMVINFTNLLHEDYEDILDDDGKYYMRFITESAARMQNLIIDLLEYSRAGMNENTNESFSSKNKFESAMTNLTDTIEDNQAIIHWRGTYPELWGNPIRFMRLVQNLIGNAIKYRDPSRVPEIFIEGHESQDHWEFSIEDNGIGIEDEYLKKIFIIFKRLHNKQEYRGTGIGLAVCQKIVDGFGGTIYAESKPNIGSKFIFTYPKSTKKEKEK